MGALARAVVWGVAVVIVFLCLIVILLGGMNLLYGLLAVPIAFFLAIYVAGLSGALFVLATPLLFYIGRGLLVLAIALFRQPVGATPIDTSDGAASLAEREKYAFGKRCNGCGEKVMNAAVKCPKCAADF